MVLASAILEEDKTDGYWKITSMRAEDTDCYNKQTLETTFLKTHSWFFTHQASFVHIWIQLDNDTLQCYFPNS